MPFQRRPLGYRPKLLQQAKKAMLDAIRSLPDVEADPASDVVAMQDQLLEKVKAALTENGIDLHYPTHQVLFHDQIEETDGDRRRQREGWPAAQGEVPRPARIERTGPAR
jgi:hypothetical protein